MKKTWICIENMKRTIYNKQKSEVDRMEDNKRGITLISLVVTIVLLLILAGIGLTGGKGILEKAKLEELKTNMLLIQAKAKEYVEEATFKMGIAPDENKKQEVREQVYGVAEEQGAKLRKANSSEIPSDFKIEENKIETCYWLTKEAKEKWGLDKLEEEEKYLICFDEEKVTAEIYYQEGYDGKYSLSDIDLVQE